MNEMEILEIYKKLVYTAIKANPVNSVTKKEIYKYIQINFPDLYKSTDYQKYIKRAIRSCKDSIFVYRTRCYGLSNDRPTRKCKNVEINLDKNPECYLKQEYNVNVNCDVLLPSFEYTTENYEEYLKNTDMMYCDPINYSYTTLKDRFKKKK